MAPLSSFMRITGTEGSKEKSTVFLYISAKSALIQHQGEPPPNDLRHPHSSSILEVLRAQSREQSKKQQIQFSTSGRAKKVNMKIGVDLYSPKVRLNLASVG